GGRCGPRPGRGALRRAVSIGGAHPVRPAPAVGRGGGPGPPGPPHPDGPAGAGGGGRRRLPVVSEERYWTAGGSSRRLTFSSSWRRKSGSSSGPLTRARFEPGDCGRRTAGGVALRDAFIAFHSTSAMIAAPTNAMRNSIGTTSAVEV